MELTRDTIIIIRYASILVAYSSRRNITGQGCSIGWTIGQGWKRLPEGFLGLDTGQPLGPRNRRPRLKVQWTVKKCLSKST